MINSRRVLTATTILGVFGLGWFLAPDFMGRFWGIAPGDNLNYMVTAMESCSSAWPSPSGWRAILPTHRRDAP